MSFLNQKRVYILFLLDRNKVKVYGDFFYLSIYLGSSSWCGIDEVDVGKFGCTETDPFKLCFWSLYQNEKKGEMTITFFVHFDAIH